MLNALLGCSDELSRIDSLTVSSCFQMLVPKLLFWLIAILQSLRPDMLKQSIVNQYHISECHNAVAQTH